MLKISKPLSTELVSTYYKVELTPGNQRNYFREGVSEAEQLQGEWHGRLCSHLGLVAGEGVNEEHYQRMAQGQHPLTGDVLVKHRVTVSAVPAWTTDAGAWRDHVETMLSDAILLHGEGMLRVVPPSEHRYQAPRPDLPARAVQEECKDVVVNFTLTHPTVGTPGVPVPQLGSVPGWVVATGPPPIIFQEDTRGRVPARDVPAVEKETATVTVARLKEIHARAAAYFQERLKADDAQNARGYLAGRGISDESIRAFGVGLSGTSDELFRLLAPECSMAEMKASGLVREDRYGRLHDFFEDRLMIPIKNPEGEVIAFTGRAPDGSNVAKYVNSPSTLIYKKGDVLFGYDVAKAAGTGRIVITEGGFKTIAAHSAGVTDAVGLLGTAMSDAQVELIRAAASDAILNLDGGAMELAAGQAATAKHVGKLLDAGVRVRALNMEGDPDSFILANGPAAYRAAIDGAGPLVEWMAGHARTAIDGGLVQQARWMAGLLERVPAADRERAAAELAKYLRVEQPGPEPKEKQKYAEHVAAFDMTVAPHKSYSAAYCVGGDRRIMEWHQTAVREMLDAGEKYTQARMKDIGGVTTENWAAALFVHDTARPVGGLPPNPHLHTHAVVFNMTRDADGKVRSVASPEWFRIQSYMTAIYQSAMAEQALAGGYELEHHGRSFATCIKGFGADYIDAISARSKEIEAEKARLGLAGAEADELVNKKLRANKQEWDPEALKAEHLRQAGAMGEDPAAVVAASKERSGRRLTKAEREKLADDGISYAKARLQSSQAVNDHYELMRDALRFGLGKVRLADVEQAFAKRLAASNEFVETRHYRNTAPGARYTTERMRTLERETIQEMLRGKGAVAPMIDAGVEGSEKWERKRDEFREKYKTRSVDGKKIEMTDQQLWLGFRILTTGDQYMMVRGVAGSGKSTALAPIAEVARARQLFHDWGYKVVAMAPTGGAAQNLEGPGMTVMTLQSAIGSGTVRLAKQKRLYILDEASLADTEQMREFTKLVRPEDRVVMCYDPGQFQAVGPGRVAEELQQAGVTTYKLGKIIRQTNPELLAVVKDIKDGEVQRAMRNLDGMARVWQIPDRAKRLEVMASYHAEHREECELTAPDNRTVGDLNAAARTEWKRRDLLTADKFTGRMLVGVRDLQRADKTFAAKYQPGDVIRFQKRSLGGEVRAGEYVDVTAVDAERNLVTIRRAGALGGTEMTYNPRDCFGVEVYETAERAFAVGERVELTRSWQVSDRKRLPNRSVGTITKLNEKGRGEIEIGGKKYKADLTEMKHLNYAYARTSYSLQFSTCEQILAHVDTGDSRVRSLTDRSYAYVALSRARTNAMVFTDDRETLLSDHSPVLQQRLKPKALAPAEIKQQGAAARMSA